MLAEEAAVEAEAAPEAPTEAPAEAAPETEKPDVASELASLRSELQQLRKPEEPEATDDGTDFIDQLLGDDPEEDAQPEYGQYEDQPAQPAEGEEELAQLFSALDERQEERFAQAEAEREFERRSDALNALAEKYPDLKKAEYRGPIQQALNTAAERNNNEWIRTDPELVEALFLAQKARETAEQQRATEQEAKDAATLETGAGPSEKGGSSDDEYADLIVNARGNKSIFT
jgi:hypothetical protein